jgi:hypothetical protein
MPSHWGYSRARVAGLGVILALALGAVLGLTRLATASAASSPRICFYTEDRNIISGSKSGHAFLQLLPTAGAQGGSRELVYGFAPKKDGEGFTETDGAVTSNATHKWHWKICKTVGASKYERARQLVAADIANPPRYGLLKFNSADWIYKVADRAGVVLPPAKVAWGYTTILDPQALGNRLKAEWESQGSRNFPRTDKPFRNVNNVFPNNVADPPTERIDLSSVTDLALEAFSAPTALATGLDMTDASRTLPEKVVGSGREVRLSLSGINIHSSITEVKFGDGSHETQRESFTHTYSQPGHYRVHGIVLAHSTIFHFVFTVVVEDSGDGASVHVAVPNSPRPPDHLPPLTPAVVPLPE